MTDDEARSLEEYLETTPQYDEIYMSLISHGLESIGLASPDQWHSIIDRARNRSDFLGTNPEKYPADSGSYAHYHTAFQEDITERYPLADPIPLDRAEASIDNSVDDRVELQNVET